jgi:hypothetical protein
MGCSGSKYIRQNLQRMLRAAFIIVLIALLPAHVRAEARIALLIGNQAYHPSVGVLKNPYNDIAVLGQALSRQGFEVLPPIRDAKRTAILGGVRDLVRRHNAAGAGVIGIIYYSGHGAAEKNTNINYLIPIDASVSRRAGIGDEHALLLGHGHETLGRVLDRQLQLAAAGVKNDER